MIDEPATGRSGAAVESAAGSEQPDAAVPDPVQKVAGQSSTPPPSDPGVGSAGLPPDLDTATRQALETLPGRSPDLQVCPFLRAGADGDQPPEAASTGHRCAAVPPAIAVSDRQRQLLCLVAAHRRCPRQTRGEAAVRAALAPGIGRRGRAAPVAIGTAAVLLVAAAAVAATSGVATPGGQASGQGDEATAAPGGGSASATHSDGGASSSPSPGESVPSALPAATVEPRPTVRPTLVPTQDLPAAWVGLEACPAPDTCFLYVVKRGDTFSAIAARFGTTSRKLRRLNPSLADPSTIRVGSTIRVPPPPS